MHWATESIEKKRSEFEIGKENKTAMRKENNKILLVAMRSGETPVHIPNTMVKT